MLWWAPRLTPTSLGASPFLQQHHDRLAPGLLFLSLPCLSTRLSKLLCKGILPFFPCFFQGLTCGVEPQLCAIMGPRRKPAAKPAVTPRKRAADQMSSPVSEVPPTPTPLGSVSSQRPRAVRPYRSPTVEDVPEVEEPAHEDYRSVLGWKVARRCPVPESAGRLRAGPRPCCVKCGHTYWNFPAQMCWIPAGMDKCGDCLSGNHSCAQVRVFPPCLFGSY